MSTDSALASEASIIRAELLFHSIILHWNEITRISNGLFIEIDGNHEPIIRYSQMAERHPRLAKDQDMMTHSEPPSSNGSGCEFLLGLC